jgi:hypothetical protein
MQPLGAGAHLDLMRDAAKEFPVVPNPLGYASARVWHCKYRTMVALTSFANLVRLNVATWPDETLNPLQGLTRLEWLSIFHLPRVTDLSPLSALTQLRHLELGTLPSWDSSGRVTIVQSLAPIAQLPNLETLHLFGVCPPDRRVDALIGISSLREVRISKYPRAESERLAQVVADRASVG